MQFVKETHLFHIVLYYSQYFISCFWTMYHTFFQTWTIDKTYDKRLLKLSFNHKLLRRRDHTLNIWLKPTLMK